MVGRVDSLSAEFDDCAHKARDLVREMRLEQLRVSIHPSNEDMGRAAAEEAAGIVADAIAERGHANIIVATGNSQLTFLAALCRAPAIEWALVDVFHLDEYVGIDERHPASFPNFLRHHLIAHVRPRAFHPLSGAADVEAACRDYEALLKANPADLCALGVGENGHLAFNDPPYADFHDQRLVKVVELADVSRRQQVGEGHFKTIEEVPTRAITLTIPAMLSAKKVLAIVPEQRKAEAVRRTLIGPVSEECPSSLLRRTPHAHLFLDCESASQIEM